jgi:riboflavin kinase/FMN adenylyltransferase
MVVIRGLGRTRPASRPSAVAIGNFDGVHLGHRKILARLRARAKARGLRSLVLTFFPHPERVLGKFPILMIQSLDQRLETFEEEGVDAAVVTPFDEKFSALSAEDFVRVVLVKTLRAAEIVVGENFRFGKGREGDGELLRTLGRRHGLAVRIIPPETVSGKVVSSSAVRALLAKGRVRQAARFLWKPYEIRGTVVVGRSRGKALGFPTANLRTENEILPEGVFITRTAWGGLVLPSLTSIGTNPTFREGILSVETHLLDFRGRLYGRRLRVRFLDKIRSPAAFARPEDLVVRMEADQAKARAYFRGHPA